MALHASLPNTQQIIYDTKPIIQTASPTTGQTVTIPDSSRDVLLYITPAGTLLAMTLALPSDSVSVIGQVIRVFFSQAITTLTLANTTPALTTVVLNGSFTLQKVAANTWLRF